MRTTAHLRDRQVLAAQIEILRAQAARDRDRPAVAAGFARGALDALVWVTEGGPGPLTGALATVPVAPETIMAEQAVADDLVDGRPSPRRDYARGVEHALMWAWFATATPPLPPPDAATVDVAGLGSAHHSGLST